MLLYNGQEKGCTEQPTLFDPDPIVWSGHGRNGEDPELTDEKVFTQDGKISASVMPLVIKGVSEAAGPEKKPVFRAE